MTAAAPSCQPRELAAALFRTRRLGWWRMGDAIHSQPSNPAMGDPADL